MFLEADVERRAAMEWICFAGFIALGIYVANSVYQEYECFAQCIRDLYAVQDIFQISSCVVTDEGYELRFVTNLSEARKDAAWILFDYFKQRDAILLMDDRAQSFVPYINRDKFVIEMGIILNGTVGLILDYENADSLWKWLFKGQYKKLKEPLPMFEKQYEMICSAQPGTMIQMSVG